MDHKLSALINSTFSLNVCIDSFGAASGIGGSSSGRDIRQPAHQAIKDEQRYEIDCAGHYEERSIVVRMLEHLTSGSGEDHASQRAKSAGEACHAAYLGLGEYVRRRNEQICGVALVGACGQRNDGDRDPKRMRAGSEHDR